MASCCGRKNHNECAVKIPLMPSGVNLFRIVAAAVVKLERGYSSERPLLKAAKIKGTSTQWLNLYITMDKIISTFNNIWYNEIIFGILPTILHMSISTCGSLATPADEKKETSGCTDTHYYGIWVSKIVFCPSSLTVDPENNWWYVCASTERQRPPTWLIKNHSVESSMRLISSALTGRVCTLCVYEYIRTF